MNPNDIDVSELLDRITDDAAAQWNAWWDNAEELADHRRRTTQVIRRASTGFDVTTLELVGACTSAAYIGISGHVAALVDRNAELVDAVDTARRALARILKAWNDGVSNDAEAARIAALIEETADKCAKAQWPK